jgi:hypothetical protein
MDHYYILIVLPLSQSNIPEKSPYEHLILIPLYSYYCTTIPIEFYHFYTIISLYHHYTIIPLKKYKITMRPLFGDHTIVSPVLYHYSQRNPIKHPMEISPHSAFTLLTARSHKSFSSALRAQKRWLGKAVVEALREGETQWDIDPQQHRKVTCYSNSDKSLLYYNYLPALKSNPNPATNKYQPPAMSSTVTIFSIDSLYDLFCRVDNDHTVTYGFRGKTCQTNFAKTIRPSGSTVKSINRKCWEILRWSLRLINIMT